MKRTIARILVVLLALLSLLSIAAAPLNHDDRMTRFTGSEQSVALLDPGSVKTVGEKTVVKGQVFTANDEMTDPRVSGLFTITVSYVYNGPALFGTGPIWGTGHMSNDGGSWNVVYVGYQSANCHNVISAHGRGEGGYSGLKAVWESQSDSCGWMSTASGYIIEKDK